MPFLLLRAIDPFYKCHAKTFRALSNFSVFLIYWHIYFAGLQFDSLLSNRSVRPFADRNHEHRHWLWSTRKLRIQHNWRSGQIRTPVYFEWGIKHQVRNPVTRRTANMAFPRNHVAHCPRLQHW